MVSQDAEKSDSIENRWQKSSIERGRREREKSERTETGGESEESLREAKRIGVYITDPISDL